MTHQPQLTVNTNNLTIKQEYAVKVSATDGNNTAVVYVDSMVGGSLTLLQRAALDEYLRLTLERMNEVQS